MKKTTEFLNSARKSKKAMNLMIQACVEVKNHELASELTEELKKLFPETKQEKEAKERAKKLNLLFRMVELKISEEACWVISEALSEYNKYKGNFDMEKASKIIAKRIELFEE